MLSVAWTGEMVPFTHARTQARIERRKEGGRENGREGRWQRTCVGFSAYTRICRKWLSDMVWHLNPFSSRHCFSHIWQYHRRRCRPLLLALLAMALGVPAAALGMALLSVTGREGEVDGEEERDE